MSRANPTWGEWLDGVIGVISPRWQAERAAWREMARLSYRAATNSRLDRSVGTGGSADFHLEAGYERDKILQRARQLERDNAIASGILDRAVDNVISTGLTVQARTEDDKWNKTAEGLFAEWSSECEVRGLDCFGEVQRGVYRSLIRDGDVAAYKTGAGKLQLIEADLIAAPNGRRFENRMVDGVEMDDVGRPIRYHLIDETKTETRNNAGRDQMMGSVSIDARDILFLARRKRIGQTRGEPAFAQSAWLFEQVDSHIEAVVVAARMAACFGVMVTRPGGFPGLSTIDGSDGLARKGFHLEPGMVKMLEPGEAVSTLSPTQPTQNFPDFLVTLGRLLGLPFGLPLELVFLDFSKTNYSSARASLLQAYRRFRVEQQRFIEHFLAPVWRWKIDGWIADGKLAARDNAHAHAWIPPGWQWVDPQAEAQGNMLAIDAGFRTVSEVVAETGRDFGEVLATRKRELEQMRAAGLPDVRSVLTRDPLPEVDGEPDADDAEKDAAMNRHVEKLERDIERLRVDAAAPRGPAVVVNSPAADPGPIAKATAEAILTASREEAAARMAALPAMLRDAATAAGAAAAAATPAPPVPDMTPIAKAITEAGEAVGRAVAEKRVEWPEIAAPIVNVTVPADAIKVESTARVVADVHLPEQKRKTVEVSDGRGNKITGTIGPG